MKKLFGIAIVLLLMVVSVNAALYRDRCFSLTNGLTCINGTTGQNVFTGAKLDWSNLLNVPTNLSGGGNYTNSTGLTLSGIVFGIDQNYFDNLYYRKSYVDSLGNWSSDKSNYASTAYVNSIGNWSNDKTGYNTTSQNQKIFFNMTYGLSDGNISSASTWNNKAGTGTCSAGYAVQNTTTGGVQCVAITGNTYINGTGILLNGNQFNISDSYLQNYNETNKINSIGNWTADKTSYNTTSQNNILFYNKTYALPDSNISSATTWNGKANPGTCAAGQVVQNTTTGGVQCVTQVTDTNSGGVSNLTKIVSPNGSIVVSYNSTDANVSINMSYVISNAQSLNDSAAISSIGNWTADKGSYNTTAQNQKLFFNMTYGLSDGNISSASSWNNKATAANCPAGQFVQNTTTSGVQCVAPAGGGTVTQVNTGSFTQGGPITGSGTIDVNMTALTNNIGNWTNDKSSYSTVLYVNSVGNWSNEKINYYNKTFIDTLGNASKLVGTCGAGQGVQNVTVNGVQCFTPAGSTYSNGSGLLLVGTQFNLSDSYVATLMGNTTIARTGSANCGAGTVAQNVTTSTGGVTSQCITLPTDTNSGGTSNLTRITSPNGSIIVSYNSTDANVTINMTYVLVNAQALNDSAALLSLGNWSADKSGYATTSYVNTIGNWSLDKTNYYNKTYVDTLGNASKYIGNCGVGQSIQNITAAGIQCFTPAGSSYTNGTGLLLVGTQFNLSDTYVALLMGNTTIARTGSANCAAGYVAQNVTTGTGGTTSQCVLMTVDTNSGGVSNLTRINSLNNGIAVAYNSTDANLTLNMTYVVANAQSLNDSATITSIGNWSADKTNYATTNYVNSVGNWTLDKTSYNTTTQNQKLFFNMTYALSDGNISSASTWNAKAGVGTANCAAGTVAQNVTTSSGGITSQCIAIGSSNINGTDVAPNNINMTGVLTVAKNATIGNLTLVTNGTTVFIYHSTTKIAQISNTGDLYIKGEIYTNDALA